MLPGVPYIIMYIIFGLASLLFLLFIVVLTLNSIFTPKIKTKDILEILNENEWKTAPEIINEFENKNGLKKDAWFCILPSKIYNTLLDLKKNDLVEVRERKISTMEIPRLEYKLKKNN